MFELLTPLQSKSLRQSDEPLQILTQLVTAPVMASQTESSGHSDVEPGVVHDVVQYPPGMLVLQVRSSSHPPLAVHVPPTFGGSLHAKTARTSAKHPSFIKFLIVREHTPARALPPKWAGCPRISGFEPF
ncbi:MAG TPA: hypothetical protein VN253_28605 [Kofleriaceae bacterium]|nr:hypothetical protein [Kofleriaceae bacterium]